MGGKLTTLVRLQRWRIDEARREIAALEKEARDQTERITSLDAEFAAEMSHEIDDIVATTGRHAFVTSMLAERDRRLADLARLRADIGARRDALGELVWERRRLELRIEQIEREEAERARRQEANAMDDQANIRFIAKSTRGS